MKNPVLLLHGALGANTQLERIATALEQQGRPVITMNFSGHGGVPFSSSGFGIEVFADDVISHLDDHRIESVDIFGYSMGGYVALWVAHIAPERVGTVVTLGTKFDWSRESALRETAKLDPEKIEIKVPAFARILQHRHAPNDWKELLRKTSDMMRELGEKPLLSEEILSTVTTPCIIYLGDKDDMADRSYSEYVSKIIPNARFALLENTPHPIEKVSFIPFLDTSSPDGL